MVQLVVEGLGGIAHLLLKADIGDDELRVRAVWLIINTAVIVAVEPTVSEVLDSEQKSLFVELLP